MKHKHAEVIKAWADGAVVEMLIDGKWFTMEAPGWYTGVEYRVQPTPQVKIYWIEAKLSESAGPLFYPASYIEANMALTFTDGKLTNVALKEQP